MATVIAVKTARQIRGAAAEQNAVAYLTGLGWPIVGRNVRVGRHDEIDIVAVDPGPPAELVCVEVRSARSRSFGAPEERIDRRKLASLYRAMRDVDLGSRLPRRIDLIVVDARHYPTRIRHLRGLTAY
jgi:putative endonuclease